MNKVDELARSWTPRRRGAIYCSPACGRNCSKAEHDAAVKAAAALTRRMGAGWKPRVWENLGWHYAVEKGVAEVHPARGGSYIAFLNSRTQFLGEHANPRAALHLALREADKCVDRLRFDIDEVRR